MYTVPDLVNRPISERRSRRTHKNSRDGCPNCRSKRIKCLEELPECSNCVKRNLHCGYLDFTEEQIKQIKLKHEKLKEIEEKELAKKLQLEKMNKKQSSQNSNALSSSSHIALAMNNTSARISSASFDSMSVPMSVSMPMQMPLIPVNPNTHLLFPSPVYPLFIAPTNAHEHPYNEALSIAPYMNVHNNRFGNFQQQQQQYIQQEEQKQEDESLQSEHQLQLQLQQQHNHHQLQQHQQHQQHQIHQHQQHQLQHLHYQQQQQQLQEQVQQQQQLQQQQQHQQQHYQQLQQYRQRQEQQQHHQQYQQHQLEQQEQQQSYQQQQKQQHHFQHLQHLHHQQQQQQYFNFNNEANLSNTASHSSSPSIFQNYNNMSGFFNQPVSTPNLMSNPAYAMSNINNSYTFDNDSNIDDSIAHVGTMPPSSGAHPYHTAPVASNINMYHSPENTYSTNLDNNVININQGHPNAMNINTANNNGSDNYSNRNDTVLTNTVNNTSNNISGIYYNGNPPNSISKPNNADIDNNINKKVNPEETMHQFHMSVHYSEFIPCKVERMYSSVTSSTVDDKILVGGTHNPTMFQLYPPKKKSKVTDVPGSFESNCSSGASNSIYNQSKHRLLFKQVLESVLEKAEYNDLYYCCLISTTIDDFICVLSNKIEEFVFVKKFGASHNIVFDQNDKIHDENLIAKLETRSLVWNNKLVSKLRRLIGDLNVYEDTVNVLLFTVWNAVVHFRSSIETIALFKSCCSNLIYETLFHQKNAEDNNSLNLAVIIEMFRNTMNRTLGVTYRYNFKLLHEFLLYIDKFANLLTISITEYEHSKSSRIVLMKCLHRIKKLQKFVLELVNYYIPLIVEINKYNCQKSKSGNQTCNQKSYQTTEPELFYFSPKLGLQILEDWFKINSYDKEISFIHQKDYDVKALFLICNLFFKTAERLLSEVFPYLSCVIGSINYAELYSYLENFDFERYHFEKDIHFKNSDHKFFREVKKTTNYLLRFISFFSSRSALFFYYFKFYNSQSLRDLVPHGDVSIDNGILKRSNSYFNGESSTRNSIIDFDITIAFKMLNILSVTECQITQFSSTLIRFESFPISQLFFITNRPIAPIPTMTSDAHPLYNNTLTLYNYKSLTNSHNNNPTHHFTEVASDALLSNFNYKTGLLFTDFDPSPLISHMQKVTSPSDDCFLDWYVKTDIMAVVNSIKTVIMTAVNQKMNK